MLPVSLNIAYLMYIIIYSCIKQERLCVTTFPNTEDSAENTAYGHSKFAGFHNQSPPLTMVWQTRVFLTNFKVFVNEVKHSFECLKYPPNHS